jgi:dihydroorotase
MKKVLLINACIVNGSGIFEGSLLIENGRIAKLMRSSEEVPKSVKIIDCNGKYLLPGVIDDQVHFREPGLTNKADIYTESRAAVAGGVTSFMEMPNTEPKTLTEALLEEKYAIASRNSVANYSFYMGVSNDNADEALRVANERMNDVCGLKVFMGSSTGNMLVDNPQTLENIFANSPMLIATHCEDEETIKRNMDEVLKKFLVIEKVPIQMHPIIRNMEACYLSSKFATDMAKKHNTRLHVLHISSTEEAYGLFRNDIPLKEKRITAEACVHHLYFTVDDYDNLGTKIKWNPAVKLNDFERKLLLQAVTSDRIDVIASDHAPHTWEEKQNGYASPSGAPLVQHTLPVMLHLVKLQQIKLQEVVQKMCHNPAICFQIKDRGYISEGYWADLVLVDMNEAWKVSSENILYKCGWSPLNNIHLSAKVLKTWVNGEMVYDSKKGDGIKSIISEKPGMRLEFNRS